MNLDVPIRGNLTLPGLHDLAGLLVDLAEPATRVLVAAEAMAGHREKEPVRMTTSLAVELRGLLELPDRFLEISGPIDAAPNVF